MSTVLHLTPSALMRAFYVPEVEIDAGPAQDVEAAACQLFILWRAAYPDYLARLCITGQPAESAALNRALFREQK
jgi:hypothetical protein